MRWQIALVSAAVLLFIINAGTIRSRVIYGFDDRKDAYQVNDPNLLTLADSTVALVRNTRLEVQGDQVKLLTTSYGGSKNLCANEPFYAQETVAFCSGFLIAPDLVVSAGHCVSAQSSCEKINFVFGFKMMIADQNPQSVPLSEVYACKQLVHSVAEVAGQDFSIIRLDRPVVGHAPLNMRLQGSPTVGDSLHVMGYPSGLPLKISDNASVREVRPSYFVANLDTYGGNSGSAVFNKQTGEVEGILVRGETDFEWTGTCNASKRCADDGCRGEDVTLIKQVLPFLPSMQTP